MRLDLQSYEIRANLRRRKSISCRPALSRANAVKENQILKKQRELQAGGATKDKLKTSSWEFYNDGVKQS